MKKLRDIRKDRGLTIYQLSEKTKLSPSYINNLENGYRGNPSLKTLKILTLTLNCSLRDLVD